MFDTAVARPIDQIIAISRAYQDDPRADKVDFGIGVYKDETGLTPIMRSVKAAEQRLIDSQKTKTYVGVGGDQKFVELFANQVLPDHAYGTDIIGIQSIGGSGAVRVLAELAHSLNPDAFFWIPDPSWPNHKAIIGAVGAKMADYPYAKFTAEPDVDAILAALDSASPGDVVVIEPAPGQQHLLIAHKSRTAIHAHAGLRRVVRQPLSITYDLTALWRLIPSIKGTD